MVSLDSLGERIISGKGVLKVPDVDESYRYYLMIVNVIREPKNLYQSFEWNPTKSLYARLVFRRDKYVLFDDKVEYDGQVYQYVNDISGQTLIAVKCAYEGILQSFVNLVGGIAGTPGGIGIFVTGVTDLIKDYENLDLGWDEVLFNCYSSTALQVRFFGAKYDFCDPDKDKKHRPPPPPPPRDKVPPDTPIEDLSPPYEEETSDDGNTDPYEGDESSEFPLGEACIKYHVVCRITSPTFSEGFFDVEVDCYGEIEGVGVDFEGSWRAYIEHHGEFAPGDEGCQLEAGRRTLFAGILETDTVEILSFVEVP
jgi:hypothetical protein